MRYTIITNPVAGKMTVDQKRSALAYAASILDSEVHGLDSVTSRDLFQCARELASQCDVLVVAGGDGTLSDIINAVDTSRVPVAFLPLGSGNAMAHALKYRGGLAKIALRIKEGRISEYDLIDCDGKRRAFITSVGFEGAIIRLRDYYLSRGQSGFRAYLRAVLMAWFKEFNRTNGCINVDGTGFALKALFTVMVVKQPYYGYGLKVVPKARFDDGRLHVLFINSSLSNWVVGGISTLTIGNKIGQYLTGRSLNLKLERPLISQVDGNKGWEADMFNFTILPGALKIKGG